MSKEQLGNDIGGRWVQVTHCELPQGHVKGSVIRCVCHLEGKVVKLGNECHGSYPVLPFLRLRTHFKGLRKAYYRVRPEQVVVASPPYPEFFSALGRVLRGVSFCGTTVTREPSTQSGD